MAILLKEQRIYGIREGDSSIVEVQNDNFVYGSVAEFKMNRHRALGLMMQRMIR